MGFFDKFTGKKTPPPASTPAGDDPSATLNGPLRPKLVAARQRLDAKDLPAALAIYDEVLVAAGDRADVLVAISGDLGVTGHLKEIIELIAPRYDALRHGPAIGLNVLQAYLALKNPEAAQHVLDILFSLNRPELEERLHGFSNAIAEQINSGVMPAETEEAAATKVDVVSFSKPIWFYGLEPLAAQLFPPRAVKPRRVAFAQLSVLSAPEAAAAEGNPPESELGRYSRALPLWLAETFYYCPNYEPVATTGVIGRRQFALFNREWTSDNVRQLNESVEAGFDYVFTGALRQTGEQRELVLRLWEVKKLRERKQFTFRWTPETADQELSRVHEQVRMFMEWTAHEGGLKYAPPVRPGVWLDTLALSLSLFLAEKDMLERTRLAHASEQLGALASNARTGEAASLAFLTARNRAERLSLALRLDAVLASSPLIAQATRLA